MGGDEVGFIQYDSSAESRLQTAREERESMGVITRGRKPAKQPSKPATVASA